MNQKYFSEFRFLIASILSLMMIVLQSCNPAPRHTLSSDEKLADLAWLYSEVEQNYAPLEYKQKLYSFDFQKMKSNTIDAAKLTQTNEEFYLLINKFVATLRDAHTSASLTESPLPNRTRIAYLGFSGKRMGNYLTITRLLPTTRKDSLYPIKVGDLIMKMDGSTLPDIIQKEFINYRNLGQPESNLTYHMNLIFNRKSLSHAFPKADQATLKVKREEQEFEVTLPWITKDLLAFTKEQTDTSNDEATDTKIVQKQEIAGIRESTYFSTLLSAVQGRANLIPRAYQGLLAPEAGRKGWDSSVFVYDTPAWDSKVVADSIRELLQTDKKKSAWSELAAERNLPPGVLYIPSAQTYPTYVSAERVHGKDGSPTPYGKYVAYMYLNTFSPDATGSEPTPANPKAEPSGEDNVVAEVKCTIATLLRNGIHDVVIDMINNGGGSLSLGVKLAQAFSQSKIVAPQVQFRTNDTWLDNFEQQSLSGPSDSERQIFKNVYKGLKSDTDSKLRLSRPWSTEVLFPFALRANTSLPGSLNIVLLVNEMCASMCDIFTGMMKDNHLATVVGAKTMGAGGNVVMHFEAPNSHLLINLTESLMLRKDGTYVENNGIEPDVAVDVNATVLEKYDPVRRKGIEVLTTQ